MRWGSWHQQWLLPYMSLQTYTCTIKKWEIMSCFHAMKHKDYSVFVISRLVYFNAVMICICY